ncbi:MAG: radical SAM protein [Promethearchaeota archaeon]|nr:MAG: radical SAM protein [Candidatus Lokiarchaeota archaeon]
MPHIKQFLLINPIRIRPVVGPIAFDYLSSSLKRAGYSVDLIDHSFNDLKTSLTRYFTENSPLAIGITVRNIDTCLFQGQTFFLDDIKQLIAGLKSQQTAPIILGGVGFSVAPKAVLIYCNADFGVCSDGEETLPVLLNALNKNRDFTKIPNLLYWNGEQLMENEIKFADLTNYYPERRFIDNLRYFEEGGQGNIETKRGCNQKCIYCADPICKGSKIRLKSPEQVCAEFKMLIAQGVTCFHICDSEFNNPLSHAKEVCRAIIEHDLQTQMTWYPYCSPLPFDDELAELMKRAGCAGINFGVDSGDDAMLHTFRRTHRVKDIIRLTEMCKHHNLILMYDLLIGGPGETRESIKTTIDLIKEVRPHRAGFSIGVRIYHGTELAKIINEEGTISENPNLYGIKTNNPSYLKPLFYLSSEMGGTSVFSYIGTLVEKDPMWFFADPSDQDSNYNYNENLTLVEAIQRGYRGAYWDILRRMRDAPL